MDRIIYVCTSTNGEYLSTFETRAAAEASWKLKFADKTDEVSFTTFAGSWSVEVNGKHAGNILCEVALSQPTLAF